MADAAFAMRLLNVILLTRSLCFANGGNVDKLASVATGCEHHCAVDKGIESMILAKAYIKTRMVNGATLALEDVTGFGKLAAKDFNAESFAF